MDSILDRKNTFLINLAANGITFDVKSIGLYTVTLTEYECLIKYYIECSI